MEKGARKARTRKPSIRGIAQTVEINGVYQQLIEVTEGQYVIETETVPEGLKGGSDEYEDDEAARAAAKVWWCFV